MCGHGQGTHTHRRSNRKRCSLCVPNSGKVRLLKERTCGRPHHLRAVVPLAIALVRRDARRRGGDRGRPGAQLCNPHARARALVSRDHLYSMIVAFCSSRVLIAEILGRETIWCACGRGGALARTFFVCAASITSGSRRRRKYGVTCVWQCTLIKARVTESIDGRTSQALATPQCCLPLYCAALALHLFGRHASWGPRGTHSNSGMQIAGDGEELNSRHDICSCRHPALRGGEAYVAIEKRG